MVVRNQTSTVTCHEPNATERLPITDTGNDGGWGWWGFTIPEQIQTVASTTWFSAGTCTGHVAVRRRCITPTIIEVISTNYRPK